MTELSAYVLERIREGPDFTLYRGRQHGSLSRVLAVALAAEHPSPHGFRRLEHEYSLAAEPLALTRHEGRTILILMDAGGEPLDLVLQRGQLLDLTCVLRIAIGLATALRQIHRRGLVHKEYAKTRTKKAHLGHDGCRCSGSPAAGGLNGSSSLEENFTKRIDFRTNFLAAVILSTSMKHLKVENNPRGAFRIRARTPPKG